ncbi:MAG: hypothetical protein OK439_00320 [Thaumarchaeota archaeon]|nr:hypothetical protein [Nitrososphaerota archaeon]
MAGEPERFQSLGIRLVKAEFPMLIVGLSWKLKNNEILLHVQSDNYNYLAPRGWWVDSKDQPLLKGQNVIPNGGGFQLNPNIYKEEKSWFCFPGWREYHDHQSHYSISWAALRASGFNIIGLITQLQSDLNKSGVQSS